MQQISFQQRRESYLAKVHTLNQTKTNERSCDPTRSDELDAYWLQASFAPDYSLLEKFNAYQERVDFLRSEAEEESSWNAASELDFWYFIGLSPSFRQGDLVLTNAGNLRAMWRSVRGTQLGLEFLGNGMLQYVILIQQSTKTDTSSEACRGSFEELMEKLKSLGTRALLYE